MKRVIKGYIGANRVFMNAMLRDIRCALFARKRDCLKWHKKIKRVRIEITVTEVK